MMSSEQAGHHYLLVIGGGGSPPSIQLPQAQYFQYPDDGRVSTNEQNIYDLTTGNNINISYYTIRYHLLQSVSLHVIIVCYNSEHQYKLGLYGLYFLPLVCVLWFTIMDLFIC